MMWPSDYLAPINLPFTRLILLIVFGDYLYAQKQAHSSPFLLGW